MRFILAAVAFVASVVLLIVGGVQYSQASNVSEVTAIGSSDSSAPITVIGHDTLASRAGTQSLSLTGEGDIFVAVGRSDDVTAWVGETLHNTVTLNEDAESGDDVTMALKFTEAGTEPTAPSPAGNDLWFEEHTGEGTLSLDLLVSPGYSLIIASDGTDPAPPEVEISWPFGGYAPMVGPLLTAGVILLFIAIALLAWALLHRRNTQREEALAANRGAGSQVGVPAGVPTAAEAGKDATAVGDWSPVHWEESEPMTESEPSPFSQASEEALDDRERAEDRSGQGPADADQQGGAAGQNPEPAVEPEPDMPPETPVDSTATAPEPEQASAPEPEPTPAPEEEKKWRRPRGRDRASAPKRQFFIAPVMALAALTLAGCAPQYWPAEWTNTDIAPTGTPTSTVEAALIEEGAMPPTLNDTQLADVVVDAAALATQADETLDSSILEPRFTADALQHRAALYEAKKLDAEMPGPVPFPTGEIVYAVPEASDTWPRVVFAVVNPGEGAAEGASPAALMLVQEDARANFKIASLTELAAGVALPEAAPVSVGAPSIVNLEGPLMVAPEEIAAAYADVIAKGDKSEFAATFDATNDALRAQVNDAYRSGLTEELDPEVISISFAYGATKTAPVGITSIDGGAIVAVSITETETLEAANDRALITVSGRTAVLSRVATSETGFVRTYTDQLLFYVPSEQTGGAIQFLGVSQAMTDAQELKES